MKKLKMKSIDQTNANLEIIKKYFPHCIKEAVTPNGSLDLIVDFDLLRQDLSESIVDGPQERYHLNWPGKKKALVTANASILKTLRPSKSQSVNFDSTRNIFIEGDNLDALKLLQDTYLGQVKLIYIDPPYNTGTNLIYKNDYSVTESEYLQQSGQASSFGARLVANPQTNGRFHSDWLSMIYSRLRVAKNLLSEDGILICAIDENEFSNLSIVIKEIFKEGGYNHDYVSVVHNPRGQQGTNFSYVNEYLIFVYPKNSKKYLADFKKDKVDPRTLRDSGTESDRTDAKNCFYPFLVKGEKIIGIGKVPEDSFHPTSSNVELADGTIEVWPITDGGDEKKWRYAHQSVNSILNKLEAKQGRSSIQIIFNKDTETIRSVWANARYDSSEYGTKLLEDLIPGAGFTYPKSLWAVYDCVLAATKSDKNALVMDFFAGSSTTAHAVLQLNANDGGNRRFIMVQAPEPCEIGSLPYKAGYKTIADISMERIRRVGRALVENKPDQAWNGDVGFRVFKIDSTNMTDVYYTPDTLSQDLLSNQFDNFKPDRTAEDLLFQVLLDWGIDLALPIQQENFLGKKIFVVDQNALIACFDNNGGITEDFVKELAKKKPLRVIFRDAGFKSDSVKINVEQIFKLVSPSTEVKCI